MLSSTRKLTIAFPFPVSRSLHTAASVIDIPLGEASWWASSTSSGLTSVYLHNLRLQARKPFYIHIPVTVCKPAHNGGTAAATCHSRSIDGSCFTRGERISVFLSWKAGDQSWKSSSTAGRGRHGQSSEFILSSFGVCKPLDTVR